jgi:hypothetical protein
VDKRRTGESLKELLKQDKKTGSKELKKQRAKELKRQDAKASTDKRKHTVYLSSEQSKKLRIYAAANDMQLSEVIEKLINENL